MKVEISLDKLETQAMNAFMEHHKSNDRVSLGEAYAYTKILSDLLGVNYHTLIEKFSNRAYDKMQKEMLWEPTQNTRLLKCLTPTPT